MPKSKRAQKITISKTQSKGRARKSTLLDEVRQCCDDYKSAYVINAQNMRNTALKEVRARLQGSRLFFGRTKLLASALGRTVSEEYKDCLHQVAMALSGQGEAGLLFTTSQSRPCANPRRDASRRVGARGRKATHDVELEAGPLLQFPTTWRPTCAQSCRCRRSWSTVL